MPRSEKSNCVFCRIIAGELKSDILYQDEDVVVVRDINPSAPIHLLVLPRAHITSLRAESTEGERLLGHLIHVGSEVAQREGVEQSGYRLILNSGPDSGQEIAHVHLHVLGGQRLSRLG